MSVSASKAPVIMAAIGATVVGTYAYQKGMTKTEIALAAIAGATIGYISVEVLQRNNVEENCLSHNASIKACAGTFSKTVAKVAPKVKAIGENCIVSANPIACGTSVINGLN